MLNILGPQIRLCNGHSRRGFLKVGALGLGGLALPEVIRQRQAQASDEKKQTAVILFWMTGGPSHIDTYDMKPTAAEQIRGPFKPIATNQPGFSVCELLPRHTGIADRLAIIRSITHGFGVHDDAQHLVQTGYPLLNARQRGQQNPAQGAVVSALRGANAPRMPAYVCVPEDYRSHMGFYQAAAYLGPRHNAVNSGGDPAWGNYKLPEFTLPKEMTVARLQNRRELLGQFDQLKQASETRGEVVAMDAVQQQAFDLITGSGAREAFDLARETEVVREKYGRHASGQSALMARRLVEAGVTFVNINLYEKDVDWWDDHYTIEKNLRKRLPQYDQALCTLIEDLDERGMLDNVLVAAFGEFGRAPTIDGGAGRGHWPRAMSALLSGGGIKTGQIIGSTTPNGGEPADRALLPGDLLASIYRVLEIDPDQMLRDALNRPLRLVEHGEPIAELF